MKIAIIADSHFGCRKNSVYFKERQAEFFKEKFFPYLIENNIKDIIHLGDFFDNRKTVNFETLKHSKDVFINPILVHGMTLHMIVGNHDSYYKSNGDLTSTKLLFGDEAGVYVYDSMIQFPIGGKEFLFVPWIYPIQEEEMVNRIKVNTADIICGHFEMNGVVYQGNTLSRKGVDTDIFSHFNHVFSGHYHKKSRYYVGSPYQMKWSDYDDPKRIIIYDTDQDTAEDVYLADDSFISIDYPYDGNYDLNNKIVKVVVKEKDNPTEFNKFIEQVESELPYSIDIKDEYLYIDVIGEDELEDDTDTLSVLLNAVSHIDNLSDGDKLVVNDILSKLYKKAGE